MRNFGDYLDILRTARNPYKGKPYSNKNTWLRLEGTFEEPKRINLRFHRTDIIRFYPDGSREIHTGWTSTTTISRLREHGGVVVCQRALSSVNGYRPQRERDYFLHASGGDRWVPFNAVDTYIRIGPDRVTVDMSTVKPIQTRCVSNPKELRRVMRHLGKCGQLLAGYAKLANNEQCFNDGKMQLDQWLLGCIDIPLEEVKLDPRPQVYVSEPRPYRYRQGITTVKGAVHSTLDAIRWTIADQRGWTSPCEISESRARG